MKAQEFVKDFQYKNDLKLLKFLSFRSISSNLLLKR